LDRKVEGKEKRDRDMAQVVMVMEQHHRILPLGF
jgi:hypothetical protein